MNSETKNCQNCKIDFIIEPEDFMFYGKMKVPPPTFCPACRLQRRLASLNHRSLYKRGCSNCGESMFTMYHPDSPFVVFCTKCYFSDGWDASDYFADYDFSRSFFEQFYDLLKKVPQIHLEHQNNNGEGVIFSNYIYRSARTYLAYGIVRSEDIFYSWGGENGNKMCMDSTNFRDDENCYDLVDAKGNYGCAHLTLSHQCIDSEFLFNCTNCTNCFMSSNLRNASYVFRNVKYPPEIYKEKVAEYSLGKMSLSKILSEEYEELMKNAIHRFANIIQSEDCTGDSIFNSKNVHNCFAVQDSMNLKHGIITTNQLVDVYDFSMSGRSELAYELCVTGRGTNNSMLSYNIGHTDNVIYCDSANAINNCFGCVSNRNKEYCILNKQYTKDEYNELVPKIITQMNEMPYVDNKGRVYKYGEYFPINFSRFAYNETAAFEFFPAEKNEVLNNGYTWRDSVLKDHKATIEMEDIPDEIANVPDSIVNEILACEHQSQCNEICTNAFRITKEELVFYKRFNIAIPSLCPNCRYFQRQKSRTLPWRLWRRACMCDLPNHSHKGKCEVEFETSYAPDRPEKVYCEKCYQQEVV